MFAPNRSRLPGGTSLVAKPLQNHRGTLPLCPTIAIPTRSVSEGHESNLARGRCALYLGLLASLLAGCRGPYVNSHIESVNAEYRQLEDYVYALEEENARLHQELAGVRPHDAAGTTPSTAPSRGGLLRRSPAGAAPRRSSSPSEPTPGLESPQIEIPPGDTPPPRTPGSRSSFQRPSIDSPERAAPADTPPSIDIPGSSSETLPSPPIPKDISAPALPEPIPSQPADKKVTHLFLHPLSGGADFDGQPGDDGLRVIVEPRNAGEQFVPEAGAVSIVVLDPDRLGEAARIARWDFDPSAARQMLAASSPGRGLKLEMPWPAAAPAATRLKLFVRYETSDGRRLQTDREIYVTPPGQAISRWTPRSPGRSEPAELATASAGATASPPTEIRSASSNENPALPLWSPHR
jgi:hypothetical protein